ncbi:MAG: methionyl-tRNA formyltransferase [Betaproteobacteria bacterium SG8_40]|nr:MAG: methionyl-tRNA formyltransferase [Betaproteobacteria bacterium SG8_40]
MRLIFAGTPAFAAAALEALIRSEHEVDLVLTRPDAAAGRGMKQLSSEVKQLALSHGLAVFQPATLRDEDVVRRIAAVGADAMVVAAYGLILPPNVIAAFPGGCINIHASLLPRWRGAAPIQHALLAGDSHTGISIMRMDEGLDTGPVYMMESIPVGAGETAGSLHDKLAKLGARAIVSALSGIVSGTLQAHAQPAHGATYAHKITREQARIDWKRPAVEIERAIRAFNPFPGAFSQFDQQVVKVWKAELAGVASGQPGMVNTVSEAGVVISCGEGALRLTELQRPGGKRLSAEEFLRGFPIAPGQRFAD